MTIRCANRLYLFSPKREIEVQTLNRLPFKFSQKLSGGKPANAVLMSVVLEKGVAPNVFLGTVLKLLSPNTPLCRIYYYVRR